MHHFLLRLSSLPSSRKLYSDIWAWISCYRKYPLCGPYPAVYKLLRVRHARNGAGSLWCRYCIPLHRFVHDSVTSEERPRRGRCNVSDCCIHWKGYVPSHHRCYPSFRSNERNSERRKSKTCTLARIQSCRMVLLRLYGSELAHDHIWTSKHRKNWIVEETRERPVGIKGEGQ